LWEIAELSSLHKAFLGRLDSRVEADLVPEELGVETLVLSPPDFSEEGLFGEASEDLHVGAERG
jgi:hypothetical protein